MARWLREMALSVAHAWSPETCSHAKTWGAINATIARVEILTLRWWLQWANALLVVSVEQLLGYDCDAAAQSFHLGYVAVSACVLGFAFFAGSL